MNNDEVTTTEILEFLQENMATKEDLKDFATKEDIKNFVTKEDLKGFSTKEDFKELRKDLRITEQRIMDHMDDKIADLEGSVILRQRKQDTKVNETLNMLDRHGVVPEAEIDTVRSISVFPSH